MIFYLFIQINLVLTRNKFKVKLYHKLNVKELKLKVPTDLIIKKAMADKGVKNARHLFQLGGGRFTYQTVCNALNGKHIELKNLVAMLDVMGFKLTYVEK